MERLLAMQERILAKNAEVAFNTAMQSAQSEMPVVVRDATNPSTNSKYARLESVNALIKPVYTQHGFSLSFGSADGAPANCFRLTCLVAHRNGHSRLYQCDLPLDSTGMKGLPNKTLMHAHGSTMSYGRRYLTLLIFNVSISNEDTDGNLKPPKPPGPATATEKTRAYVVAQLSDIRQQLHAYLIDRGVVMPDEALEAWPLESVPCTPKDIAALRSKVEAYK